VAATALVDGTVAGVTVAAGLVAGGLVEVGVGRGTTSVVTAVALGSRASGGALWQATRATWVAARENREPLFIFIRTSWVVGRSREGGER
jgi:hypothetical protein